MDPRIGEIVSQLDRLVSADGADVIAVVAAFWQTFPAVARHRHDCLLLATPAGFLRLGIEFLKAGVSPAEGKGPNGDKVPFEIDYLLRKDSELLLDCERLERQPTRRPVRPPRTFEWQVPDPPAGHEAMALLGELDGLVPGVSAEVLITVPQSSFPSIPMQGTPEGFVRFGLEFARGAVVAGSGQGRNRGEIVVLDLDDVLDPEAELVFDCERVAALPEGGDRRREGEGIPFIVVPAVLVAAFLIYFPRLLRRSASVSCAQSCSIGGASHCPSNVPFLGANRAEAVREELRPSAAQIKLELLRVGCSGGLILGSNPT